MKSGILIVARCGSTRLPKKHLQLVEGRPILLYLIRRLRHRFQSELAAGRLEVVIATSDEPENRVFESVVGGEAKVFYGSVHNLPLRQKQTAEGLGLDGLVSVDGDDILTSAEGVATVLEAMGNGASYARTAGLPFGMNSFGYTRKFLADSVARASEKTLETGWGRIFDESQLKTFHFPGFPEDQRLRFSLDYTEDLEFFRAVLTALGERYLTCGDKEIVDLVLEKQIFHNARIAEQYWENFHRQVAREKSGR